MEIFKLDGEHIPPYFVFFLYSLQNLRSETTVKKERKLPATSETATTDEHKKKTTKPVTARLHEATKPQTQSTRIATAAVAKSVPRAVKKSQNDSENKLVTSTKPIGGNKPDVTTPRTAKLKAKSSTTNLVTDKTQTRVANPSVAPITVASKRTASVNNKDIKSKVGSKQPLRAKHSLDIVDAVRRNATRTTPIKNPVAKPNAALDTYHNVTVTSPPPKRRLQRSGDLVKQTAPRPPTRTLDAADVVILKAESSKQRSEKGLLKNEVFNKQEQQKLKEPVAFEVNFKTEEKFGTLKADTTSTGKGSDEDTYGEDDFETYESDFETGSSTQNGSLTETDSSSSSNISTENCYGDSAKSEFVKELVAKREINEDFDFEESELTQFPVTVIQCNKDSERKLDSGSYEIRVRQERFTESSAAIANSFVESLETLSAGGSEQLDSGISNLANTAHNTEKKLTSDCNSAAFFGGYEYFSVQPVTTKRGLELISKIQFDTLTFTLLDMKPVTYEDFMQTHAQLNTTQSTTQTLDEQLNIECQTDECNWRSMWTQHPPLYDLQTVQTVLTYRLPEATAQNCCGELAATAEQNQFNQQPSDPYDATLQALSDMRSAERLRSHTKQLKRLRKPVDIGRLNQLLFRSAILMSHVLNANTGNNKETQALRVLKNKPNLVSGVSLGYRQLDVHFLNALQVVRIFANANHHLLLTVHAPRPGTAIYRSHFSQLMMLWSAIDASGTPLRLLSSWSEISCAEICQGSVSIVVCGRLDGSLGMWDLQETHSLCSKLDGHLTHFAPTQSILPNCREKSRTKELRNLGSVVGVRSFRTKQTNLRITSGHNAIQLATLHETGILTIWSLIETGSMQDNLLNTKNYSMEARETISTYDFTSPWASVKLTQSAICDLHSNVQQGVLKSYSKFRTTKSLFEKNIYSDEALRELGHTLKVERGVRGLHFTCLDAGCERVYVCSNQNFILSCSKSLKAEMFARIVISVSTFLYPTTLRVFSRENFLGIGLSDGSVMMLNCNQNVDKNEIVMKENSEEELFQAEPAPFRSPTHQSNHLDSVTGKSCAIQNLILNERRHSKRQVADFHLQLPNEARPSSATQKLDMINTEKGPFEMKVNDQQIIMSGPVLRKSSVQALELSIDGGKLFALCNGQLRVYDFFLDREINENVSLLPEKSKVVQICDVAVTNIGKKEQNLVLLDADNNIQLHLLKP